MLRASMTLRIRAPRPEEIERLRAIEIDAARRFRDLGMDEIADAPPQSEEALERARGEGRLWLAELDGNPVGMALTAVLDGQLHLAELDVVLEHRGRGIGRALVEHVCERGRALRASWLTLHTFRDVPWNAPYYARLGFEVIAKSAMGPELARATEEDHAHFEAERRVCMRRRLSG